MVELICGGILLRLRVLVKHFMRAVDPVLKFCRLLKSPVTMGLETKESSSQDCQIIECDIA